MSKKNMLNIDPDDIKKLRIRLGLSQPKFALLLGIDGKTETLRRRVMRWESGDRKPDSNYVLIMLELKNKLKELTDDPQKLLVAIINAKDKPDA